MVIHAGLPFVFVQTWYLWLKLPFRCYDFSIPLKGGEIVAKTIEEIACDIAVAAVQNRGSLTPSEAANYYEEIFDRVCKCRLILNDGLKRT